MFSGGLRVSHGVYSSNILLLVNNHYYMDFFEVKFMAVLNLIKIVRKRFDGLI